MATKTLNTLTFVTGETTNTYQVSTRDFTPEISAVDARVDETNTTVEVLNTDFLALKDKVSNTVIPDVSANKSNIATNTTNIETLNDDIESLYFALFIEQTFVSNFTFTSSSWIDKGEDIYTMELTSFGGIPSLERRYIELSLDSNSLLQMTDDGISSLRVDNDAGTLTAVCMGARPTADLSGQLIFHYVEAQ